jgi:16S rRNA (adenine1518-N6/adenine1519-N6)-dimethyltransferase
VLVALVRQAFGNRRKMLRRSLDGRVTEAQFTAAGIASDARPEQLDVAAWGRLAEAVGG